MEVLKSKVFLLIFSFTVLHFTLITVAIASEENWADVAVNIEKVLIKSLKVYEGGKNEVAMEMVADAYFGVFEGEKANMEVAVRRFISLKAAIKLEKGFNSIRKAMYKGAPLGKIKKQISDLVENLREAAKKLDGKGVGLDVSYR